MKRWQQKARRLLRGMGRQRKGRRRFGVYWDLELIKPCETLEPDWCRCSPDSTVGKCPKHDNP